MQHSHTSPKNLSLNFGKWDLKMKIKPWEIIILFYNKKLNACVWMEPLLSEA